MSDGWAYDFDDRRNPNIYRVAEGPYGYSPVTHPSPQAALKAAIRDLKRQREMIERAIKTAEKDLADLSTPLSCLALGRERATADTA